MEASCTEASTKHSPDILCEGPACYLFVIVYSSNEENVDSQQEMHRRVRKLVKCKSLFSLESRKAMASAKPSNEVASGQ